MSFNTYISNLKYLSQTVFNWFITFAEKQLDNKIFLTTFFISLAGTVLFLSFYFFTNIFNIKFTHEVKKGPDVS
jgi:hypothetical protein